MEECQEVEGSSDEILPQSLNDVGVQLQQATVRNEENCVQLLEDQPSNCHVTSDHSYAKFVAAASVPSCIEESPVHVSDSASDHSLSQNTGVENGSSCSSETPQSRTNCENISPIFHADTCEMVSSTPKSKFKPVSLFSGVNSDDVFAKPVTNINTRHAGKTKVRSSSKIMKLLEFSPNTDITPRKKKLIQLVVKKERSVRRLQKKCSERSVSLSKLCTTGSDVVAMVNHLSESMSGPSASFLASQFFCSKKRPKGRRWQLSDKVMALALYKRSPKCYSLLSSMFALPSKTTLINMMAKIMFEPGVNGHIFDSLKKCVSSMEEIDRTCVLMFDEMSLHQHFEYSSRSDSISGFEDLGHLGRSSKVANHALVFMAKGLYKKWKQPVAFYFTTGNLNSDKLVNILQSVLEECQKIGLNIVATVCDMGSNNTRALKLLGASEEKPFFQFKETIIITLFDPPHLLKCLRNMLFKHIVALKMNIGGNNVDCKASWLVIRDAYNIDLSQGIFRMMYKLTDNHLEPKGRLAMKVSLAAQVLSHTVAGAINCFVSSGKSLVIQYRSFTINVTF